MYVHSSHSYNLERELSLFAVLVHLRNLHVRQVVVLVCVYLRSQLGICCTLMMFVFCEILYNEAPAYCNNSKCCNNYMFAYNTKRTGDNGKDCKLQRGGDYMKRYGDMAWMQSTCYYRHGNNDMSMPCLIM